MSVAIAHRRSYIETERCLAMLKATSAKVHWDDHHKHWTVEIQFGAEVVKRPIADAVQKAAVDDLKSQAIAIGRDEGYELDPAKVVVQST